MATQYTKHTLILTVLGGLCCPIADASTVEINECKYLDIYQAEDTEDSIEVGPHTIQIAGITYDLRKRDDRAQLRADLSQCGLSESQMMTGSAWDRDPERAEALAKTVVKDIHKRYASDTSGFEQRGQDCTTELTPAACDRAIDHARLIEYPWGRALRKAAARLPQQASDRAWEMYRSAEQSCNSGFLEQTGLSFDWADRITICKSAISLAEQSRALTEHYPDTHKSETGRSSAELSLQIRVIEERVATMHDRQSAAERAELAADQERRRIAEEQARQELAAIQDQQRADEERKRQADAAAIAAARRYETGAQLLGLAVKVVPFIENPYGYNLRGITTCRIGIKKGAETKDTEYSAYYAILYEVDIVNAFGVSGRYYYPIEVLAPFKLSIPDVSYELPKDLAAWFKTVGIRTGPKWILPGKVGILKGSMTGTSVTVVGDMSDSTQRYTTRPSSTWCTDTLNWGVSFQTI